ncbi:hypothetical protein LTR94_026186 [Friedmanniomyces endolithicus]|nr:hypothetical protein LTR94_026186 [Friedmanniomyces endolithicus]
MRSSRRHLLLSAVALTFSFVVSPPGMAQTAQQEPSRPWSLAIHGGAGVIERAGLTPEQDQAYRSALQKALDAGSAVLESGGNALDAVQAAIQIMEDDPLFNAGRGAVFTAAGKNELDAAVMNGADLTAGSVASLTTTRHPIAAARAVMEKSPHVMLMGEGADKFAASQGLEQVDNSFFFTERRWQGLMRFLEQRNLPLPTRPDGVPGPQAFNTLPAPPLNERKFGTVGAVALDSQGHLAAGTSTGGTNGKQWGRVGDAPIIGAGTYASDAEGCAAAAEAEIADVGAIGGDGGVIVMGKDGSVGFAMNTSGMYRAEAGSMRQDRALSLAHDDELEVMAREELDAACAMPFIEVEKITPWGDSFTGFAPSAREVEVERRYLWAVEPKGGVVVEVEVRDPLQRTGAEARALLTKA